MPEIAQLCCTYPEEHTGLEGVWSEPTECKQELHLRGTTSVPANWADIVWPLMKAFQDQLAKRWYQVVHIEGLEREILLLKRRCDNLERIAPVLVPIESFALEPYEIIKPFHVVVKFYEGQYIASFFDANLGASGDTQEEAVLNLKDLLIETFDMLNDIKDEELGPGPLQQKAVLKEFITSV